MALGTYRDIRALVKQADRDVYERYDHLTHEYALK